MTTVVKFNAAAGTAIAHSEVHQRHERESTGKTQIAGNPSIFSI